MTNTDRLIARGTIVLALIAVSVQTLAVFNNYGLLWLKRVWRLRDRSAEARGANYLMGGKAAKFLWFMEERVPSDEAVAVPPESGSLLSMQNILRF